MSTRGERVERTQVFATHWAEHYTPSMRTRLLLGAWLIGILLPLAWVAGLYEPWRAIFDRVFHPEWMHVVMHLLLFGGLALLLVATIQPRLNWKVTLLFLGFVLLAGFGQETLQSISAGDAPGWPEAFDLAVDLLGGGLGLAAVRWAGWWRPPEKV